ncbi:CAP-Gly domain-containing linker protein 1-like [Athalia rosae]|uniref:CAP-Gly domain-containing linker protein 1-like n=1 Tax=Athalia rosae TaxID=37344 RepID=UPI0020348642|nr:CAP-Gly domain-containing linker protein 1-like [Athalia rosae]
MSYAEYGPRVFFIGGFSNRNKKDENCGESEERNKLLYGDYVLPRKRSEGRLKAFESCTDIRAWSKNTLDNSNYIRELSEHAKTPGKIVPLNVVIDNVIGLGAQTGNELVACKKELQRYKCLVLTPEQEYQLKISAPGAAASPKLRSRSGPPEATDRGSQKSEFGTTVRSYSASPGRSRKPARGIDKSLQTDRTIQNSRGTSPARVTINDYEKESSDLTNTNYTLAASSSDKDLGSVYSTSNFEAYYTEEDEDDLESKPDIKKEIDYWSNSENKSNITPIERTTTSGTHSERTGTETGTGSYTDSYTDDGTNNKATIIQKDSHIIALKNELGAKEAEIEELKDLNKLLERSLREKDEGMQFLKGNLKKSEQQLAGIGDEMMIETEKYKNKIGICECLISELKGDLKEKVSICRAQAHEIEELRYRVKEAELLRVERDSLARKVNEMDGLLMDAEKCAYALSEMKSALRERDELRSQNREQSCLLADQEDEIQRLLSLVERLSHKYEGRQIKMKGAMESMRTEIDEKNVKICECEEQLTAMEKEVGSLNVKLKNSLNSMDEFKIAYEDACNCADLDNDIYSQLKNALCKFNLTMLELKEYKSEKGNLLRQIDELKNKIRTDDNQSENKTTKFCSRIKNEEKTDNKYAEDNHRSFEMTTLNLRKRKCLLKEELDELEEELKKRTLANPENLKDAGETLSEDQLDVVATAKRTIDRVNNAMLDLDTWKCEKAIMEETIERLKIQISTLAGRGGENVERKIVEQASNSMAKLNQLHKELKQYQDERQCMKKQIKNLTDALKDSESALTCKGVTILKQRLYDLRLESEKDRAVYLEELKNLHAKLEEAESTSGCSGIKALRLKLKEALRYRDNDAKVDQALAIHVKKSIEKIENISKEMKEVDDDRDEIVKEIAKKQDEIEVRNVEISKLRKQMAEQVMARKGEGDRAEEGLKELAEARQKLEEKTEIIMALEDRVQSLKFQLIGSTENQSTLKSQVKLLEEERTSLAKEVAEKTVQLAARNEEITQLFGGVKSSEVMKSRLEELDKQIEKMRPRYVELQNENEKLLKEVTTLKNVLSERNEEIIALVDDKAKSDEKAEKNSLAFKAELSEKSKEFDRVSRANKSLTTKLLKAEGQIINLEQVISGLNFERVQVEQISDLQREITRMTKEKSKLEGEFKGLRNTLTSIESSNRKLDNEVNRVLMENETLRSEIRNLAAENSRIGSELVEEITAREKLSILPDKLNNEISVLKARMRSTEKRDNDVLNSLRDRIERFQIKCEEDDILIAELQRQNKLLNDQANINAEKIEVLEKANAELKSELNSKLDELNELSSKFQAVERDKKQLTTNFSEANNIAEITCRLNHAENENKQRQTEIHKLQCDVKSRNAELNSLREEVKLLTEERDSLTERIRNKEIQNSQRLQALKVTYEGSLKVMYENHNQSVARLQSQYEEAIKDSDYFDSESWLRSLTLKEISDLHERICMSITSCPVQTGRILSEDEYNIEGISNQGSVMSVQRYSQDFIGDKHQLKRKISTLQNEIRNKEMSEIVRLERQKNAELRSQLSNKSDRDTQNMIPQKTESEKDYGIQRIDERRRIVKNLEMDLVETSPKSEVYDDRRKKDFIYQCSLYKEDENN